MSSHVTDPMQALQATLQRMTEAIAEILAAQTPSIYLYGSCTMDDFRPGWSDIDLLVLTQKPFTLPQAEQLLMLRQNLPLQYPDASLARSCEGGILPLDAFTKGYPDRVVYWGTSGQRITDRHHLSSIDLWELQHRAQLLHGPEVRNSFPLPTPSAMHTDVAQHLRTILDHGRGRRSLYAFGWLLDTARGLYTLRHDAIASKTAAGEWALREGLCPDEGALRLALEVRREPALLAQEAVARQAEALTPAIQAFAGVLRQELEARGIPIPD